MDSATPTVSSRDIITGSSQRITFAFIFIQRSLMQYTSQANKVLLFNTSLKNLVMNPLISIGFLLLALLGEEYLLLLNVIVIFGHIEGLVTKLALVRFVCNLNSTHIHPVGYEGTFRESCVIAALVEQINSKHSRMQRFKKKDDIFKLSQHVGTFPISLVLRSRVEDLSRCHMLSVDNTPHCSVARALEFGDHY